jgi:hypothetical protein
MKKKSTKKLELRKSTINTLNPQESLQIKGGSAITGCHSCWLACPTQSQPLDCCLSAGVKSCKYTECIIDSKCVLCYAPSHAPSCPSACDPYCAVGTVTVADM